jgi:hypothetical protein
VKSENEAAAEVQSAARQNTTNESNASTPLRRSPRNVLAELADAIESAWVSRFGRVPVVAAAVIDRIRRGTP